MYNEFSETIEVSFMTDILKASSSRNLSLYLFFSPISLPPPLFLSFSLSLPLARFLSLSLYLFSLFPSISPFLFPPLSHFLVQA